MATSKPTKTSKHSSLDRVLGRIDTLDTVNLANLAQRLARERRLFENIFETLQEGVLLITGNGYIEYANQMAYRLLGLRETEIDTITLWRLIPGLRPTLETLEPDYTAADVCPHTQPVITREIELTYPDPRTVRVYMVPFRDDTKTSQPDDPAASRQYALILTDITGERAQTEARIEDESTASVRLLAAGVAHELGNPLNSLTIHLQLIERRLGKLKKLGKKESASLADSITVCQEEVQRLDGIITHFLDALRPRLPDLAETRLGEVLAEVLRFEQRELENRHISAEVETPGDLPVVMADRNQLKQIFFNIIKNAMEAMQPGGTLRIKSRSDDDFVYLLFGDTGEGIKQENLAKLFQPYHTTKPGGHGLGLMIVQRIMRDHGGQIGIESKEGIGTLVTLQFPRKDRRVRMLR